MDPLAPPLPSGTYKNRPVAKDDTQPNDGCCKGLWISLNRIGQSVQSFFAFRINSPAQNPSGRPGLRLSRPDETAPVTNTLKFTSKAQYEEAKEAQRTRQVAKFEKNKAIAIQKAIEEYPELRKIPPRESKAPSQEIKTSASAPPIDTVQCKQDEKEKRELAIALFNQRAPAFDLFIEKLAITIQTVREQAISALKLSFDPGTIFDDFQNRFPKYGMPCKETDIDQVMWLTLHSMHLKGVSDAMHPPQFKKIMQDARNKIPELLLLNITGKEIGAEPGNVTREDINHLYRACFHAAWDAAFDAIRKKNPAVLRRLDDDQFKTAAENYKKDFFEECDRLSLLADNKENFVSAVLVQAHKNVKIRVESCEWPESLRKIDEMLAASITSTMLLAKMSSAAAIAPLLLEVAPISSAVAVADAPAISPEVAQIDTAPSTAKAPQYSYLFNRPRS